MNLHEIRPASRVVALPYWPEHVGDAIVAAVQGARSGPFPIGVFWKFGDGSTITLEYQETRRLDVAQKVYEHAGSPPLLSIVVDDQGAGVRIDKAGLNRRIAANDAEKALAELQRVIGKDKPMAVLGEVMAGSSRQYWVKVEA